MAHNHYKIYLVSAIGRKSILTLNQMMRTSFLFVQTHHLISVDKSLPSFSCCVVSSHGISPMMSKEWEQSLSVNLTPFSPLDKTPTENNSNYYSLTHRLSFLSLFLPLVLCLSITDPFDHLQPSPSSPFSWVATGFTFGPSTPALQSELAVTVGCRLFGSVSVFKRHPWHAFLQSGSRLWQSDDGSRGYGYWNEGRSSYTTDFFGTNDSCHGERGSNSALAIPSRAPFGQELPEFHFMDGQRLGIQNGRPWWGN